MAPGTPHFSEGPEPWERIAWQLHDRLEAERRRGKVAAEQLAKRALQATEEIQPMAKATPQDVIAQLQVLRDQAELDGDEIAADAYTEAIRAVRQAQGGAAPAAEEPAAEEPKTPAEQLQQAARTHDLIKASYARPLL